MAKSNRERAIARRVRGEHSPDRATPELTHTEAFALAYGRHTARIKTGTLGSRQSDEAAHRAAVCIHACEGLALAGLADNGLRELIDSVRAAERLLSGRLVRVDPEATLVATQLKRAQRKLGLR